MLIRAALVLLLALNLGVAAWWLLREAPPGLAPEPMPAGVLLLQLVGEPAAPPRAADAAAPAPAAARACFALGPFADTLAASQARAQLQAPGARVRLRREPVDSGRGWRVYMPPQADTAAAQALAARIGEAGIDDFMVMRQGTDVNAIALGRYGTEATARRRVQALADAGFGSAVAEPLGDAAQVWLDIDADPALDADAVRAAIGASQRVPRACTAPGGIDAVASR